MVLSRPRKSFSRCLKFMSLFSYTLFSIFRADWEASQAFSNSSFINFSFSPSGLFYTFSIKSWAFIWTLWSPYVSKNLNLIWSKIDRISISNSEISTYFLESKILMFLVSKSCILFNYSLTSYSHDCFQVSYFLLTSSSNRLFNSTLFYSISSFILL